MKLVLAEKPSVAQSIAKVLGVRNRKDGYLEGNGYIVSWCVGHLVELAQPESYDERFSKWSYKDLPIIPDEWKYRVSNATKKQFDILKKLIARKDVESLVCATDAGREGELIFRLVYAQCQCKKPVERLWISSMEDVAIKEGFENLKAGTEYDALYEAALCRERADWIVGINATRLFSTLYGQTLNVGRVMTPTLAMTVLREADIQAFCPEPFYTVVLNFEGFDVTSEKFKNKEKAYNIQRKCNGQTAIITNVEKKERTEKSPALYDLTSLQRDANRVLGYTAQQTLDYTQSLYEKKLVTYPRTDSRYLTEDMADTISDLVNIACKVFSPESIISFPIHFDQVINNKKVTDHHAIIPTKELHKCNLSELPKGELAILKLIATRLMAAVAEPYRFLETIIEANCSDVVFSTKGKTVLDMGWKGLDKKYVSKKSKEKELPLIEKDTVLNVQKTEIKEGKTSPCKHFTEDTLLSAMETAGAAEMPDDVERKGLGTPATRAGIIEKLVRIGFLERIGDKKTKYLIPTQKGIALVTIIPEQIQSPSMTAEWEEKLKQIEHKKYSGDIFMREIKKTVTDLVSTYEVIKGTEVMLPEDSEIIGKCPICGSSVKEKSKGYFCSDCKFALWKNNRYFESIGKYINKQTAKKLLQDGKVKMKGCKSRRTGKNFDAVILMRFGEDNKPIFSMEFGNGGKR